MKTLRRPQRAPFDPVTQDVPTRTWTVLAQDPSVLGPGGRALTTTVSVPAERLEAGPKGHRINVIDFDATRNVYYQPRPKDLYSDRYENVRDIQTLVRDPYFHQQNVYATAMSVLADFQTALGRSVPWGFAPAGGTGSAHHLKIAPHAFADPNAYYARESESLSFGYFTGQSGKTAFTCLSHDIVAHETSHALLDGMRSFYLRPSHVDQSAFHEGFADVVALLSILKSTELVELALADISDRANLIASRDLSYESLRQKSILFKLAKQFNRELSFVRGDALRHSVALDPSPKWLSQEEYQEPHRRGEILVAAISQAFLRVWCKRLEPIGTERGIALNRTVVAEEATRAAEHLLHIMIRALDYVPPVDLVFGDYLSALLTADMQLYPDDSKFHYRRQLREAFASFGITPSSPARKDGAWDPPEDAEKLIFDGVHFEPLRSDLNEVFRFLWENRDALGIDPDAFTRVTSVRPCTRVSTDGLVLRETVVEYVQTLRVFAHELRLFGIKKPEGLSGQTFLPLYGGGTLVFNEYGHVKFHIGTGVRSKRQSARLQSLYDSGAFNRDADQTSHFADLHRRRMLGGAGHPEEQW